MSGQDRSSRQDSATKQVQRLRKGHTDAQVWLIDRFTPALFLSARNRIDENLQGLYDPEDLVQEVWAAALPNLKDLRERNGKFTPVLLKYLSSILVNKYRNLLQKHLWNKPLGRCHEPGLIQGLTDEATTTISRVIRKETWHQIQAAIDVMQKEDHQIVILRGIEQVSNREASLILGLSESTVSSRYRRALSKLRESLPDTFFSDLS